MSVPTRVTVTVPARLHFGFLDLNGGLGRRFGSIGLAISGLRTRVSASRAGDVAVTGIEAENARRVAARLCAMLKIDGGYHLHVEEAAPRHAGLGSGTQMALAVAAALRGLHGIPADPRGDAVRLGRGDRSGIGIGLFDSGGLVVDGGRGAASEAAPVISRMPFPPDWRIVLVLDRARTGVHGDEESAAFARLPSFPASDAAHICRIVMMQALPALAEQDLPVFAAAIKEMQRVLGAHFAPLQGGQAFASPDVAAAIDLIEEAGGLGRGQSSWGPTGFIFARSAADAERLVQFARNHPRCRGLDIFACQGLNRGAEIETGDAGRTTDG
ncbi:MAG: beta-ribofuranosylaminobenzene 5'-phosphate synthase family protein [Pseudolabrys sp.]